MNVLFILPQIPYPPHSGGRIVTWNTVKRFSETCRVSVVCLYHHPSELESLHEVRRVCEEVAAFPAHGKWSLPPLVKSLASFRPYKAHRFWNPQMAEYIQRLLQRRSFDVIHAQNFYTASYVEGRESAFKIHYKENIEGNILLRFGQASGNPLIKLAAWLEGLRTRRHEVDLCRRFDQILAISPLDRDALLALDEALPVQHQRPGVDLAAYPFLDEPAGPPSILFTGTMSYYPNAIGVQQFLRDSWPLVRKQIPEMECWIVGAHPSKTIRDYDGRQGVHVTGRAPSIDEYLRKTSIYIVPLTIGGGIRLKILEAMASGRAIVSTSIGCEGLDVQHDGSLLIANEPQAFAQAIVALAQDSAKRSRIRKKARCLVEEVYDWDRIIPRQVEQYRLRFGQAREGESASAPPC
ncbi:MAG: glycosyltransferase [Candidatus Omnitrophica bacterium]|nr:glycosyltransferase [Candidatus Omnitrophota bacterium]